jgi:hypothetical protein
MEDKMIIRLAHAHFNEKHLDEVKNEMHELGNPTIRVLELDDDLYLAVEGCHRIRAAFDLGLTPKIEVLDYDVVKNDNAQEYGYDNDTELDNVLNPDCGVEFEF